MTREEAISIMNVIVHMLEPKYDTDRVEEAVDMAIKALENEDSVKKMFASGLLKDCEMCKVMQEPCENCDYSEIMDWEQDAKTGKAKPIYWCTRDEYPCEDDYQTDMDEAWKQAKREPCDDAISRQAVLDGIEELKQSPWATDKRGNGFEYLITEALDTVADLCVKQEPSVRPQEQTGHWIIIDDCEQFIAKCSKCGRIEDSRMISKYPYCHCGTRMVEPQESEENNG